MDNLNHYPQRKKNQNRWTCPICNQEMNSSGAPGHFRNKHKKNWRNLYLYHPESIFEREKIEDPDFPVWRVRDLFCGYDYSSNDNANRAISNLSHFTAFIVNALDKNDKNSLERIEYLLKHAVQDFHERRSK